MCTVSGAKLILRRGRRLGASRNIVMGERGVGGEDQKRIARSEMGKRAAVELILDLCLGLVVR